MSPITSRSVRDERFVSHTPLAVQTATDRSHRADRASLVRAEYLEMPGLSLTRVQVRRLWSLDGDLAVAILDQLLSEGFLRMTPKGTYVRADGSIGVS